MAEEHTTTNVVEGGEVQDRGLFNFLGKKEEEKPQEEVITTEMENLKVSECEDKKEEEVEKKPSLLEKLHRSDSSSSSSSSSEEEVEEGGEKIRRKKKKGLKEKIKEKISGDKVEEEKKAEAVEDTSIPIEKCDTDADVVGVVAHDGVVSHPEEKKTFMEKIKEKLPGGAHTPAAVEAPPAPVAEVHASETEPKEKKGIFEKIKEKIPGYHKTEEEKKETTTDH